jgi:hypothetical protein
LIDTIDVYTQFGISIEHEGLKSVVQYPTLKPFDSFNWAEEDGIDVDASEPVFEAREVTVQCTCVDTDNVGALFDLLSDGSYHVFNFDVIGKSYMLRLDTQPTKTVFYPLEKFSLKLIEDKPYAAAIEVDSSDPTYEVMGDYVYTDPVSLGIPTQDYALDTINLAAFGLRVLTGTFESVYRSPDVKTGLVRNIRDSRGNIYNAGTVCYKEKEATMNLLLTAPDLTTFWTNYEAFLYKLVQPELRTLYADYAMSEIPCFYKSSQVNRFELIGASVWCEFSITFCFISFRRAGAIVLLGSELTEFIESEDSIYLIDTQNAI